MYDRCGQHTLAPSHISPRKFNSDCALSSSQIRRTQRAIKHALTERWYAWQEARKEAVQDPEVNLEADTSKGELAYSPKVLEVSASCETLETIVNFPRMTSKRQSRKLANIRQSSKIY